MADPLDSNALKDAKAGDLAALEKRLDSYPLSPEPDRNGDYATADQLVCAAAHGRHAEMVQWLIETRFPTYVARLQAHLAAIQGGPDIYAIFLHKWPHLIHYELGHMGNPLGLSVFNNDTPMIKFLLERGVDPNTAQIFHIQVSKPEHFPLRCAYVDQNAIDLLVEHGFEIPEKPDQKLPKNTSRCMIL